MLLIQPALLLIVGVLVVVELVVWIAWRLSLRLLRRDVLLLRLLLSPMIWFGDLLRLAVGTDSAGNNDSQSLLLERAVEMRSEGNLEEAVRLLQQAANRLSFRRDPHFLADILLDRALCLEQLGRVDEALRDWEFAFNLSRDRDSSFLQIRAAYCRGLIERRRGNADAAIEWLQQARAAARDTASQRIPAVSGMTESLIALYRQQGQLDQAIQLCQVAVNEWGWSGNKYKQADMLIELADLQADSGDHAASVRTLRLLRTMAEVLNYQSALDRVDSALRRYHSADSAEAPRPLRLVGPAKPDADAEPEPKVLRFPDRRG